MHIIYRKNKNYSERCFVGLIDRFKEEWKRPIEGLIEKFPQFCNGILNKFVLLLRKGVILVNAWIAGKDLMKHYYRMKKIFPVN